MQSPIGDYQVTLQASGLAAITTFFAEPFKDGPAKS
jgi:hypothetical protein